MGGCTPPRSPVRSCPRTADRDLVTKHGHCRHDRSGRGHSGVGGPNPALGKRGRRHGSGGRPGRRRQSGGASTSPACPGLRGAPGAGRRTQKAPPQQEPALPTPPSQTSGSPNQEGSGFHPSHPYLRTFLPQPRTLTSQPPGRSSATATGTHVLPGPARASPAPLTRPGTPPPPGTLSALPCFALTPLFPAAPGHPSLPRPPAHGQGPGSRHQPTGSAGPRDPQGFGP